MNSSHEPHWHSSSVTDHTTAAANVMLSSSDVTVRQEGLTVRRTSSAGSPVGIQVVEDYSMASLHSQASMYTGTSPIKLSTRPQSEFGAINPLLSTSHSIHLLTPPIQEHGHDLFVNASLSDVSASSSRQFLPASQTSDTVDLLLQKKRSLPVNAHESASSSSSSARTPPWKHGPSTMSNGSLSSSEKSKYEEKYIPAYATAYQIGPEDDDVLHDPKIGKRLDDTGTVFTVRGCLNIGTLVILASGLLMLFAGYPILTAFFARSEGLKGGFGLGGSNATGQIPMLAGMPTLIDKDTPVEAYERMSIDGTRKMKLVFSDEFNQDGRSFYPGDDPFWEAVDLHYWGTNNYEWYDPAAVTTQDGNLVITLAEAINHNMWFRGGMIQTWNKFCFTGGYIEVNVVLPGSPDISGLWPAAWTMGNLGRAGYGATNDGMWPYTYDTCDVGTLANQTWPASMGGGPLAAETTGAFPEVYGPGVSYLPGQRLSRCTCPDYDDHPGPKHPDGTYVGRSSPEIDILEAQASQRAGRSGHVSMSLQLAPYDAGYNMSNDPGAYEFYEPNIAELNSYLGSVYQQAASGIITTQDTNYEDNGMQFDTYGFEYRPGGGSDAHITWTRTDRPMWQVHSSAIGPNPATEIGQRPIPYEPMYIILNLGMSSGFSYVDFSRLQFPAKYYVDYVRVWQPEDEINIGCDPPAAPTKDYIERHWEAYNNANLTIWNGDRSVGGYDHPVPPNRLLNQC